MVQVRVVKLYRDDNGEWRYRALAFNNRTVGASEEGFARKAYARKRIETAFPGVPIEVIDNT